MTKFSLKESTDYYLQLSQQPVRFEPSSSLTNIFFDDTNGQVVTVRSGGVTGVTVNGMDSSSCTSFTMEDKGSITSIKFSPDQRILAIQRNMDIQSATVEFMNFKDLAPTNVEFSHMCKWKNAKILGFVWPKINEIAFVTDHGIELLQVLPDKKQCKSLKNTSFSAAWFSWCSQSKIVLLAGNNGELLQPFSLNNSTISKLQKHDLDICIGCKPITERDVSVLRVYNTTWCSVIRHVTSFSGAMGPAEIYLTPLTGAAGSHHIHVLVTGLIGRFAVHIVDDLIVVHHQASQTSLLFDIMEKSKLEKGTMTHIPIVQSKTVKPCVLGDQPCPLYSGHWVVPQPDYIIDVRLGCLWKVLLNPSGLAHQLLKDDIPKIVAVLLRRAEGKDAVYRILNQLVEDGGVYLVELGHVFDEINAVYRKWADLEMSRNTGHNASQCDNSMAKTPPDYKVVITQSDMYSHVLQAHSDGNYIVQVLTSYIASLCKYEITVQHSLAEMCATTLVRRGQCNRLRQCIQHSCLGDSRALACLLLSLGNVDPAAAQLALDMMWRLRAYEEIVEVLLSWHEPVSAVGAARQASGSLWRTLPARKVLSVAQAQDGDPGTFAALYRLLENRNRTMRNTPHFVKGEQCDSYVQYYKKIMSE